MNELSFLVDLFLNHKLPAATRRLIGDRIKEIGDRPVDNVPRETIRIATKPLPATAQGQSASTIANMMKHGDIPVPESEPPQVHEPVQPAIVAQTPATIAAMQSRQAAIGASISRRVDKQTGRPRKF